MPQELIDIVGGDDKENHITDEIMEGDEEYDVENPIDMEFMMDEIIDNFEEEDNE